MLDVYDYYTAAKKLPTGAADDYFSLVLDFCNDPSSDLLHEHRLRALKPSRAERVVAEMARWFDRSGLL